MSIINTTKPSDSYVNTARVSVGETWASIDTTWASETRTWAEIGSFLDNLARVSASSLTNIIKPS